MNTDKNPFELLAPGGDIESIKAAIIAGADAVYCGLDRFNARNRATNITFEHLTDILALAHQHHCKIFVTLNIIILENEFPALFRLLNQLVNTTIDGVIIQDLGLGYLIKHYFPTLDIHASTQMNTHNEGQILFARQLGVSRVNLSRELSLQEIKPLTSFGRTHGVLMEVFVHGSYCIGFSGHCYMSSVRNGASGNRGRCSQPCRDTFQTTPMGIDHPLNMKDNCAYHQLDQLKAAGVYSLKIEGRMKKPHYVFTTVDQWRKQIDYFLETGQLLTDMTALYTVFNRDFSTGYLDNHIGREMYIDNPRDHSAAYQIKQLNAETPEAIQRIKQEVYDKKTDIIEQVNDAIHHLDISTPETPEAPPRVPHQELPILPAGSPVTETPSLSVLISNIHDVSCIRNHHADLYFELPTALNKQLSAMIELFNTHHSLLPWFPAVLINENYDAAKQFLAEIAPRPIITNNTGVAHMAAAMNIPWTAGPQLNITNSYALQCLQQEYSAHGAFISNEINLLQMRRIKRPENFRLYYSIYHPITLMTSRQCFFLRSIGCKKSAMNKGCLPKCEKHASIVNLKGNEFIIQKQSGQFNSLYSPHNFLNTEIVEKLRGLYTDFFIDLRDIKTHTQITADKPQIIEYFHELLLGKATAQQDLNQHINPTSARQYTKGL